MRVFLEWLRWRLIHLQNRVDRRIDHVSDWFILHTTVISFRIYDFYQSCKDTIRESKEERRRLKAKEKALLVKYATEFEDVLNDPLGVDHGEIIKPTTPNPSPQSQLKTEYQDESHAAA
jgi:hypothetical protein